MKINPLNFKCKLKIWSKLRNNEIFIYYKKTRTVLNKKKIMFKGHR